LEQGFIDDAGVESLESRLCFGACETDNDVVGGEEALVI
jgi:hypothetical protein